MINTYMREILEQLQRLMEAEVKPGERKEISFRLERLDSISSKLQSYKKSLSHLNLARDPLPPELEKSVIAVQDQLDTEIKKVETAYNSLYEKSTSEHGTPVKMENLFKALQKNCKQIIKVYKDLNKNTFTKKQFLYRGVRSSSDALYGKPFDARNPKDSNSELHQMLNDAMKSGGFVARRDNATFVTGDRGQASGYGHSLYVIFPVDGFKYTWSRTEKDVVLGGDTYEKIYDKQILSEIREKIQEAKKEHPELTLDPNEVFRYGHNYDADIRRIGYAVSAGQLSRDVLLMAENDLITDESIIDYFDFSDEDLFDAIVSKKEIYLSGAYYAVNASHMQELIKFLKRTYTDSVELPESFGETPISYDIGDIVKILNGPHAEKIGTVTYVFTDRVHVKFNMNEDFVTVSYEDITPYLMNDGKPLEFNLDEKVIITNPENKNYGKVGKIDYFYGDNDVYVSISTEKNGKINKLLKNELFPYSEELDKEIQKDFATKAKAPKTKFKIGDEITVTDQNSPHYSKQGTVTYVYSFGTLQVKMEDEYTEFNPNQVSLTAETSPSVNDSDKLEVGDRVIISTGEWQGFYGKITEVYGLGELVEVDLSGIDTQIEVAASSIKLFDKKKKAEPKVKTEFKVGDRVLIKTGEHGGKEAVINYLSAQWPDEADLKIPAENNKLVTLRLDSLELIPEKENEANQDIDVGDYVKVIWSGSSYYNEIGQVIETGNHDPNGNPEKKWIKFTNVNYPNGVKTFNTFVTRVDSPATVFNSGDQAILNNTESSENGKQVKVMSGPDEDGDYKVVSNTGKIIYASPDQLTKIESTFKVGDMVKIKDSTNSAYAGKTGEVMKIEKGVNLLTVKIGTYQGAFYFNEVESSTGAEEIPADADGDYEFKIGDYVKIVDPSSSYVGKSGEITSIDGVWVMVGDTEHGGAWAKNAWIEKVANPSDTAKAEIMEKLPIELGDTVIATGPSAFGVDKYIGKQGKVTYLETNSKFAYVDFGNGVYLTYGISNLKKASSDKKPEFEVGDRVEVVSQFPSLIGKTGTITQTAAPPYDFVTVKLDDSIISTSSFPSSALKKIDAKFMLDDVVQVTDTGRSDYGKIGKINFVYPSGKYGIEFEDGHGGVVAPSQIKKYDRPSKSAPVNSNAEQTDFKIGDLVTITNKKLSTFNKVGKIVHLPETEYGFVQIVLSDGHPAMAKTTSIEKVNTTNTNSKQHSIR